MLVRVTAAGIGFADVQIRAGLMRTALPDLPLPFAPGFEVAGTVAEAAGLTSTDTVLVEAAAEGVGSLLVQLAKRAGATVVAAARGETKLAVAEQLGADVVIDYGTP